MPSSRKKMSAPQRAWCRLYQDQTGFDAMMEDFVAGNMDFHECATRAVRWYESHTSDAYLNISRKIPGEDKALYQRIKKYAKKGRRDGA